MVRKGDLSAEEVAQDHLNHLDTVNPTINAVVQQDRKATLAQARGIDAQIARGEDPGPMAGVPVTTKVNIDQAGFATTNGLRSQSDLIAREDSPVVSSLRKAGAVFVGRTNTPAFSLRWFTNNGLHGITLNPRDPTRTPGGSSGGAAAAVAAGLCAIAHGTDIAGSIRYPAYACGIHGLRPTFGRVPTHNATGGDRFIGAQLMAVSGPLARSMDDIELALHAMSARDIRDPWHVPAPLTTQTSRCRAALSLAPDGMEVENTIKQTLKASARALENAGWTVDEIDCPPLREAAQINAQLWMAETQRAAGSLMERENDPDANFVYTLMQRDCGPVDADTIMRALQRRAGLVREWETFLDTYPVLICPISGTSPFLQQQDVRSEEDFFQIYEAQLTQRALPVMGMPALAVATGATLSVQLVSGRFRESILLDAGRVIEAASAPVAIAEFEPDE